MQGKTYTRDDIVRILDAKIQNEIDRMGEGSFWVKVYKNRKDHMLAQYDAGEKVLVEYDECVKNGVTYCTLYFSDGSIKETQY